MLSFICASNNMEIYEQCVVSSLAIQKNTDFELILINTAEKEYSSAAKALNEGANKAKGDYLVFLHHDIVIEDENFVDKLNLWLDQHTFGIAGVAGTIKLPNRKKANVVSNIVHGEKKQVPGIKTTETVSCETLDECLFVISRKMFSEHQFVELMPTWHLYCVEYCLWAKEHNYDVLLTPMFLWHKSAGASMNMNYFEALFKLKKIYKKDIYTTMGTWSQNYFITYLKIIKYIIKNIKSV